MEQQDKPAAPDTKLALTFLYEEGRLERKQVPAVDLGRAIARAVCEDADRKLLPYQLGDMAAMEAAKQVREQPEDVRAVVISAAREEGMALARTRRHDDVKMDDLAIRATFGLLARGLHVPLHDAFAAAKALDAAWMKALGPAPSLKDWDPTDPFGTDKAWRAELASRASGSSGTSKP